MRTHTRGSLYHARIRLHAQRGVSRPTLTGSTQATSAGKRVGKGTIFALAFTFAAVYGVYNFSLPLLQRPARLKAKFDLWRASLGRPDYTPLADGQIRLLILEPGEGRTPPVCRLVQASLERNDTPPFEALSYVWGDGYSTLEILCDEKPVRIGESLFTALRNLRLPDRSRILWVDALCINQGDDIEKSRQIPLMGRIYELSSSVVIWLGEASEASNAAIPTLRKLHQYFAKHLSFYSEDLSSVQVRWHIYRNITQLGFGRQQQLKELAGFDWAAVGEALHHSWFRRVWVFQEFAKATKATIVLGQQQMPLIQFIRPLIEIFVHPLGQEAIGARFDGDTWQSIANLMRMMALRIEGGDGFGSDTLLRLVASATFRQATDDRDRVFAFLSVANDVDEADWEVAADYTVSAEQVYTRLALWYLLRKRDLEILRYAGRGVFSELEELTKGSAVDKPVEWMPSWAPNWKHRQFSGMEGLLEDESYAASPTSFSPQVSWRPAEPNILRVKGRIVDGLEEVSVSRSELVMLDNFEFTTKIKFGSRAFRSRVKWEEFYNLFRWNRGENREFLNRFVAFKDTKGQTKAIYLPHLREAYEARKRFGNDKLPAHEIANVIWMENCKSIASGGTGEAMSSQRFDEFWRTMVRNRPDVTRRTFISYLKLLEDVRDGKKKTPRLQQTSFEMPRIREAATRKLTGLRQSRAALATHASLAYRPGHSAHIATPSELAELEMRYKMHAAWSNIFSRRFCSTSSNRLGWVPQEARPGDLVCVFDGAKVPMLLRPVCKEVSYTTMQRILSKTGWSVSAIETVDKVHDPVNRYELIGECYIHGIMQGEAIMKGDGKGQIFELC